MSTVLFFGDSITYGEYDGVFGGFADILKRFSLAEFTSEKAKEVTIYNLGIPGETSEGILKRIEPEIQARISDRHDAVFLFYGANDLAQKEGRYLVPVKDFALHISAVVDIALKFTKNIYIISILPLGDHIDGKITPNGKIRRESDVSDYNSHLKRISTLKNIRYLDLHDLFSGSKEKLLSSDGVHPNGKGYRFIADYLRPLLHELWY
ncbi:GDSL-type esterase/lipase family protein [Weeksellaceae bacterium A-14]